MEQIMKKINSCISICYVINIAILQARGEKVNNHLLVDMAGNMSIDEINEYLTLFYDNDFLPFKSKIDVANNGAEQVRALDTEIVECIWSLNKGELIQLMTVITSKRETILRMIEKTINYREKELIHLLEIDRKDENVLAIAKTSVKDMSRKLSILKFFEQRYLHYLQYIKGLLNSYNNNIKLELFFKKNDNYVKNVVK